jgi:single-strand DNA-binding protein
MARSVNRVILVGNAGSDPDIRSTGSGTKVAHVSLATDRTFRLNGQEQSRTDWHRLTFWGKVAELAERLIRKGTKLYVEGRIEYGSFERDGVSIPTADIIVQEFLLLEGGTGRLVRADESEEDDAAESEVLETASV